jgi:hypothetical protein
MLEFLFFVLGILIGINFRHERAVYQYNKTLEQVDQELRNKLRVAENLNVSLKKDKDSLKEELWKLRQKEK